MHSKYLLIIYDKEQYGKYIQMCTPKITSSFNKIRIIIIKTSVTFLLVNRLSMCTRQPDCQLSVHTNIITVYRNLVNSLAVFNICGGRLTSVCRISFTCIIDAVSSGKNKIIA